MSKKLRPGPRVDLEYEHREPSFVSAPRGRHAPAETEPLASGTPVTVVGRRLGGLSGTVVEGSGPARLLVELGTQLPGVFLEIDRKNVQRAF